MDATKLKLNTYIQDTTQLALLRNTSIQEVILEHKVLSRLGTLTTSQIKSLANQAKTEGYSPILQWDILGNDEDLQKGINIIKQLPLHLIQAIRVQDLGVAELLRTQFPEVPLHLIVESGNHNLIGLQHWVQYFKNQIKRLIISTELPETTLKQYCHQLEVPCEILGVGRILLFYTPRNLLTPFDPSSVESKEKIVTSDEHQHHYFPIIENQHGTFMFHYYNLFLLDMLPALKKMNLSHLRIDLRFENSFDQINKIHDLINSDDNEGIKILKSQWHPKTTHGFFRANRTDRSIGRLKNKFLQDHGENLIAYVVESTKDKHIALISRQLIHSGESLLFVTPEGKRVTLTPSSISNSSGDKIEITDKEGLWLIPHHKWIVPQTLVYRVNPTFDG